MIDNVLYSIVNSRSDYRSPQYNSFPIQFFEHISSFNYRILRSLAMCLRAATEPLICHGFFAPVLRDVERLRTGVRLVARLRT